jgi:hypothetical protein
MELLNVPDLCARLDRLRTLCDQLEGAQTEPEKYRTLVARIRVEAEGFTNTVVVFQGSQETSRSRAKSARLG